MHDIKRYRLKCVDVEEQLRNCVFKLEAEHKGKEKDFKMFTVRGTLYPTVKQIKIKT